MNYCYYKMDYLSTLFVVDVSDCWHKCRAVWNFKDGNSSNSFLNYMVEPKNLLLKTE